MCQHSRFAASAYHRAIQNLTVLHGLARIVTPALEMIMGFADAANLRKRARMLAEAGDVDSAIDLALQALAVGPARVAEKQFAARLIHRGKKPLPERLADQVHTLLVDPDVNPRRIERAGWALLHAAGRIPTLDAESLARWLEQDDFAQALLRESHVTIAEIEHLLTGLRRWLLLGDRSADFPNSVAALARQAAHNAGAWLIDPEERAKLGSGAGGDLRPAYFPERPRPDRDRPFASDVTRQVAAQYDSWPYPAWHRAMAGRGESFTGTIAAIAPDAPPALAEDARVLIAGCGSGLQAMTWAQRFPQLKITAIDISASALAYAEERRDPGLTNLRLELCDLHDAAHLGTFDVIAVSGVLHHLPDPEAGWAALTRLLVPGGVMRVAVYSALARLMVRACQARIADLAAAPIDDDVLRAVRARLMEGPPNDVTGSPDFFHLGGVHDLLLHRHEDAFDVPRIRRALDRLGLELLRINFPGPAAARYRLAYPHDHMLRDTVAWAAFERRYPRTFAGMYDFWCRKPG